MADELIAQHVISPSGDCQCTLNDNVWLPGHDKNNGIHERDSVVCFCSVSEIKGLDFLFYVLLDECIPETSTCHIIGEQ